MAIKIVLGIGLVILGVVFAGIGIKSRPHKLKKEYIRLVFRANLPHELEEPWNIVKSSKTELIGTAVWVVVLAGVIALLAAGQGHVIYLFPSCGGVIYTFWLANRQLLLYPNAVVYQTLTGRKVYFLDELDYIESYNIVNDFNRGVSYGYQLVQEGKVVLALPKGAFKHIDFIEIVYGDSPYRVEEKEEA